MGASGVGGSGTLACDACGQLPHPHRVRLTLVKLLAVLPLELGLHAAVLAFHPPLVVTVLTLAFTTTVLVIWVVEPSAMHLLTAWLHGPALRHQRGLHAAEVLWRVRVTLDDQPGALERLTRELTAMDLSIMSLHVHPLEDGVLDELVVGSDRHIGQDALTTAVRRGGARTVRVWPTTALSLVDGQTRALDLAAQVAERPHSLPDAVADLLGAQVITDTLTAVHSPLGEPSQATVLRIPTPWSGLFAFTRPDSAFTPAERARAARLAQIAESSALRPTSRRFESDQHGQRPRRTPA